MESYLFVSSADDLATSQTVKIWTVRISLFKSWATRGCFVMQSKPQNKQLLKNSVDQIYNKLILYIWSTIY